MADSNLLPIVIFGPTASGKSDIAEQLSDALDGVIINADSLQVYKGLPMLTAQPKIDVSKHLLYGFLDPGDKCDVAQWLTWAKSAISNAQQQGKVPIIVGGTGFYIKSLLDGIASIPEVSQDIYHKAETFLTQNGAQAMLLDLQQRAGPLPAHIRPEDEYRLLRAWAVFESSGVPLHVWQQQAAKTESLSAVKVVCSHARDVLYNRINSRFIWMWKNGILEEVSVFRSLYHNITHNFASKAIGFLEVCDYLDNKLLAEEAIAGAQMRTRQYAKRQLTWLRHQFKPDVVLDESGFSADKVKNVYLNVRKIKGKDCG